MKQASDILTQALNNPLIKGLPPFMSSEEMASQLSNRPLADFSWKSLPLAQRAILLNRHKLTFCVTGDSLRIAMALQSLLWDGLLARDPRLPEQRRVVYEAAEYDHKQYDRLQWRADFTGGITIRGITGVGKSAVVNRFLNLIPQVIRHDRNDAAQWVEFAQLVYLKVPISADGSRGGFLQNCLLEMDKALGTNYFQRHQGKQWTVERLLVNVLHYLSLHRCGLLVIEEAQQKNLGISQFSRDFLTFFLRLLNHGIPVVIVGNPMAFTELDAFSQDQSRFSEYGDFRLDPIYNYQDEEWRDAWMTDIWCATLLDEKDEPIANLNELIWGYSGGFPRYLARLRRETLSVAIQMGSVRVCRDHIEIARMSPAMKGAGGLIAAFVNRNWQSLEKFSDIPIGEIRMKWSQFVSNQPSNDSDVPTTILVEKDVETYAKKEQPVQTERSKSRKRAAKNGVAMSTSVETPSVLDPNDIRSEEYLKNLHKQAK